MQLLATTFTGTGRGMHAWADLSYDRLCAIGTEQRLQLVAQIGGQTGAPTLYDITPYRLTTTAGTLTTASGTAAVTVSDTNASAVATDWIYLPGTTTVGGLTLNGFYQVTAATSASAYKFNATVSASSTATSGPTTIDYLIHTGLVAAVGATNIRQWFLDNWGQDLIGNYAATNTLNGGSPIYVWTPAPLPPTSGDVAIAINTTNFPGAMDPPSAVNVSFVAMPEQIMVALGCDLPGGTGVQDPNLVRWSDVADFTDWLASTTNQAGSFRIPSGSRIVSGIQTPLFACLWTDVDLWVMSYIGTPFVFGFNKVSVGTELLCERGAAQYQSVVYWVSHDNFYSFDGQAVRVIPCSVWDQFFLNLYPGQHDQTWAWSNHFYNEVWWFYASAQGTGQCDSYVKYNTVENTWDYGSMPRTCGQDENAFGQPLAFDNSTGLLQQHEVGYDANGSAITAFVQTGFVADGDGTNFAVIKRIAPDILWQIGTIQTIETETMLPITDELGGDLYTEASVMADATVDISVLTQDYTTDTQYVYGPFPVTPTTPYCIPRARGRTHAINFQSSGLGVFWRLGAVRVESGFAGKR